MVSYSLDALKLFSPYKLTAKASLGYDVWGFNIACENSKAFVSTSSHSISVFDLSLLFPIHSISAHSDRITSLNLLNNQLASSSHDAQIHLYDTRSFLPTTTFKTNGTPIECMDVSSDGNFVGCGTQLQGSDAFIYLFDVRNPRKPFVRYDECHSDDITQFRFHPFSSSSFISCSTDGLVCLFDATQSMAEEEALVGSFNVGDSIQLANFFGPTCNLLYTSTDIHTLKVWDVESLELLSDYGDIRNFAFNGLKAIDYVIYCHYDKESTRMFVLGGTFDGQIKILHLNLESMQICTELVDGHVDAVVRDAYWNPKSNFILTCGEDAQLCLWSDK